MDYDRMSPDLLMVLLTRLQEYSKIDYGTEAYPLSKTEANVLLDYIVELQTIIHNSCLDD